jgi:hypothetical protein
MEWGVKIAVLNVGIGSRFKKDQTHLGSASHGGGMKGSSVESGQCLDVGSLLNQQSDHLRMSKIASEMQWSPIIKVPKRLTICLPYIDVQVTFL